MKITETKEGAIMEIFVKPKSRDFKIMIEADEIVVFCREEPVEGKVNKEIIKELSKLFHRKVELVSGFSSRQKRLLIVEAKKNKVEQALKFV
jgi:hypothetical protein